jgi:hypothetical protein
MRGFKSHEAADRFCREHGELRHLLRLRHRHNQTVSVSLGMIVSAISAPLVKRERTYDLKHSQKLLAVVG